VDNRDVAGLVAQEALVHTLAREKRAHAMRVNIVAPGLADTESGVCPVPLYPTPAPASCRSRSRRSP
jgi:NAD(P)-dependent dehydrogenase (short-subunit alcohol dehydrogenase family)